jgi:multiple sugar transport system permease protein
MNKKNIQKSAMRRAGKIFLWICIGLLIFITLFPFFWVLRTSFTPHNLVYVESSKLIPSRITGSNYPRILGLMSVGQAVRLGGTGQSVNFLENLKNSFIIAATVTIVSTLICAMAAYAFSRLQFPGRNKLFTLILAALMVPGIVTMIPNFVFVRHLGLLNTYAGIMAPTLIMTPYSIFFLRQFFLGINKEIEEAAWLDGAGQYRTFFQIILPLMQTALVTIAVTTFINTWNDYMWPLIVGKKESIRTLTVALGVFRSQTPQGQPDWGGLMAGTVLAVIPALGMYSVFGRKIVNSVQFNGFR